MDEEARRLRRIGSIKEIGFNNFHPKLYLVSHLHSSVTRVTVVIWYPSCLPCDGTFRTRSRTLHDGTFSARSLGHCMRWRFLS